MTMTLVPIDGALAVISKMETRDPEAAESLLRFSLFDSVMCQANDLEARISKDVLTRMAAINKVARTKMLRSHVGKAISGEPEPDDLEYAKALGMLDTWVEKGLIGSMLAAFNQRVHRDEKGQFASTAGHRSYSNDSGPRAGAVNLITGFGGNTDDKGKSTDVNDRARVNGAVGGMFGGQDVKNSGRLAEQWYGATQGVNRQAYNRLNVTGQALSSMGQPGSAVHAAGTVAQLAGQLGPEAERVLGPSVRRTAYRYRGTEKTPDAALRGNVDNANIVGLAMSGKGPAGIQAKANALISGGSTPGRPDQGGRRSRDVVASLYANHKGLRGDKAALAMRGDAAVATFLGVDAAGGESHLPSMDLVALSIESGEMPPSEGVVIGESGKVLTQSVGYNGDHYLPFDLTNLKGMGGGQYVRTRATGGLTGEDIYTSMAAGVRQAQVVSNSGVFTLEFDPSFRGARRHNDKARRMIERYTTLLGAIDNKDSSLFTSDIPRGEQQRIRQDVARIATSQADYDKIFQARMDEARLKSQASTASPEDIEEAAGHKADAELNKPKYEGVTGPRRARMREDMVRENIDEAYETGEGAPIVQRMKLDGEGYYQAMRALKQEFPYYIRQATFEPLDKWTERRNLDTGENRPPRNRGVDRGFTEAGQTNARSTMGSPAGKTGFRTARQVPTTARARSSEAAQEDAPGQGGAPRSAVTPGTGSTIGTPQSRVVSPAELVKSPSYVTRFGQELSGALREMADLNVRGAPVDPSHPRDQYAGYDWGQKFAMEMLEEHGNKAGLETAKWFMNPATPEAEKRKLRDSLAEGASSPWSREDLSPEAVKETKSRFAAAVSQISDHELMSNPFDAQAAAEAIRDGFGERAPRIEGVPAVGSEPSLFDRYLGTGGKSDVATMVAQWDRDGDTDKDISANLEATRASYVQDVTNGVIGASEKVRVAHEIKLATEAWAFKTARDASAKLRAAVGVVDAPKASAPVKAPAEPTIRLSAFDRAVDKSLTEPEWVAEALRALGL